MRTLPLFLALLAASASAQTPDSLTVREAVALVNAAHPLVQASEAMASSREAAAGGVTAWAAPTLGYAMEGIGTSGGFVEQRVVAGVEVGPASLARAERARLAAEARAFGSDAEEARRALRARVVAAYVDLGIADSLVSLRREAVALADSLVAVARLREEAGEAAGLETLRAELEAEQARAALAAAVGQREAARAAATASVGLRLGETAAVAPRLRLPEALPPTDADSSPVVAAAAARAEAAQAGIDAAQASRLPVWSAEVFPQHFGGDTFGAGVQIGVRLPLGQSRLVASRVRAAESARQSAEAERDGRAAERAASVAAAEARVRSTRVALEAARGAPVDRAEALLTLALRGYQLGEVTQPLLLSTRQALLDAREVGLEAFRDALLAVVAWERASSSSVLFL